MRHLIALILLTVFSFANASSLEVGQVWAYKTRPGENGSTLTVLKIEQFKDLGQVVHVRIDGIRCVGQLGGHPLRQELLHRRIRDA